MAKRKKPKGRPVKYVLPPPIDAPPEQIADVVLRAKSKKVWRCEEQTKHKKILPD